MSRVLITGSSGFIGQHLVKALEARGDEVIKLHRTFLYDSTFLASEIKQIKPNFVFHLAAYGNMSFQKDDDMVFHANLQSIYNLLSATRHIRYKAFINVSSSSVLLPHQTMYSATKLGAEALCKAFVDEYDKPIVTIRPASVFGEGEADFRFIPTVFRSCLDGEPMDLAPDAYHNWIHVSNVVDLMLRATDKVDFIKGKNINCATDIKMSNENVVSLIEEITGKQANIRSIKRMRAFDTKDWHIDNSYYNQVFGGIKTSFQQGLQLVYDDILNERKEVDKNGRIK